ncbi:uncharacterized protein C7orf57 homolog isoform X2 [Mya arenaria]|uniref:uncharacterized protein C7orf57 homolog isoform X2 n=1 Tax=Mya arenaria TaxID=6604 RepID=UPI0022E92789|nr:uncharacterized protein C7orf57 homolog isoform X2 [Mya arenaria]
MTTNQNVNEAGWFYHAPARRRSLEPVGYPAMSQIPGLAEDEGPPEEPPRSLFRETDTKYVRLAKQGGRQNLLMMKENSGEKKPAAYYPRNEWFYLADNAMEDEAEKKKNEIEYDFLRPEYMVHEAYKQEPGHLYERPARGPISHDKLSVFERDGGKRVTDKTVRLPEVRKPGYGVRSGKPLRMPKHKPQSADTEPGRGPKPLRYLPMPGSANNKEKPKMSKIIGYAYEREWQDEHRKWQDKQETGKYRHQQMTNIRQVPEGFVQSEYNMSFGKPTAVIHTEVNREDCQQSSRPSEGKSGYSVRQTETQRLREAKLQKSPEKEVFKMTRFKNIPARTESHRPQAV